LLPYAFVVSELTDALVALGVSDEEIDAATKSGTLLGVVAERFLLPGERTLSHDEIAARVGVDPDALAKLWLSLGFPARSTSEKLYTERDLEVVRLLFAGATTFSEYSLHESRVISGALARIAEVFIDEVWDDYFSSGQTSEQALGEIANTPYDLERMERMLMHLLRRHLLAAIYRRLALHDRTESGMAPVAIGFADVVGFTSLSSALAAADLTRLVVGFEQTMTDLVTSMGGRVVKTIGDEVMFAFDDMAAAADFALRITVATGPLPPVRVGLAWGPVLVRQGDCFGPTVNLASRVVGTASGGEVVVEPTMAVALRARGYALDELGERELKSFGTVTLWRLRPTGDEPSEVRE
jgi:adenylate cyclase